MFETDHNAIARCSATFVKNYSHFIRQTPLWILPGKALGVDCAEVWLKLEHMQTGGSFKARGMLNRLLSNPIPASGVVIASGGNAGIAVGARLAVAPGLYLGSQRVTGFGLVAQAIEQIGFHSIGEDIREERLTGVAATTATELSSTTIAE